MEDHVTACRGPPRAHRGHVAPTLAARHAPTRTGVSNACDDSLPGGCKLGEGSTRKEAPGPGLEHHHLQWSRTPCSVSLALDESRAADPPRLRPPRGEGSRPHGGRGAALMPAAGPSGRRERGAWLGPHAGAGCERRRLRRRPRARRRSRGTLRAAAVAARPPRVTSGLLAKHGLCPAHGAPRPCLPNFQVHCSACFASPMVATVWLVLAQSLHCAPATCDPHLASSLIEETWVTSGSTAGVGPGQQRPGARMAARWEKEATRGDRDGHHECHVRHVQWNSASQEFRA